MSEIVMANLVKAINTLKDRFGNNLRCIETGTIRSYDEHHDSTLHIAKALGNRGILLSIDINPKSIEISKNICKEWTNIGWKLEDSIQYLKRSDIGKFHFAFLDTKNNPDFIFEEFRLLFPKMIVGGIIIVDDAGVNFDGDIIPIAEQKKGHKISKFLRSLDYTNFVRYSSHGTQLWIDVTEFLCKKILGRNEDANSNR